MNYQQQANDLLNKLGVKFSATYIGYGKHFADDKQDRHTFRLKLSRGRTSFSVKFGQSIAAGSEPPTAYDLFSCLQKYDVGSFEDFCGDFGYDTDSRTAERIYKAVCKEWEKVSRFFTSEEIEQLQEIQ